MRNKGIEDINIGDSYQSTGEKKSGSKIIKFFLILLVLVVVAIFGYYIYKINYKVSIKSSFVKAFSIDNIETILDDDIYVTLLNRIGNEDSNISSDISVSYPKVETVQAETNNQETENTELLTASENSVDENNLNTENNEANVDANIDLNVDQNVENVVVEPEYTSLQDILEKINLSENISYSDFSYNLELKNNIKDEKTFANLNLGYQGNDVISIKMLKDGENYAIGSDDVINVFVSLNKFMPNEQKTKINNVISTLSAKDNEISQEKIDSEKKEITELILNMLAEENFSSQENIVLQKDDENVNVTSYTLTLSQSELNEILKQVLLHIKNDDELLEKVACDNSTNNNEKNEVKETNSLSIITNVEDENQGEENNSENLEESDVINAEVTNYNSSLTILEGSENQDENDNQSTVEDKPEITINLKTGDVTKNENDNDNEIDNSKLDEETTDFDENDFQDVILAILLGNKTNFTKVELQNMIDEISNNIDSLSGNGIKITLYKGEKKLEKISITMPNNSTLDIDNLENDNGITKIKITGLYNGNKALIDLDDKLVKYYTANEILSENDDNEENSQTGFTLELTRTKKDSNNILNIVYGFVESDQINRKINIDITTKGQVTSNSITNDLDVTYLNKDAETKFSISSKLKFEDTSDIDSLADSNCLFLEKLSTEEFNTDINNIINRINYIIEEKETQFNIINTSQTRSSLSNVSDLNSALEKEAQEAAYQTASQTMQQAIIYLMQQAENNGEEFTLKNLEGIQIQGHNVTVTLEEDYAIIEIDGFKFKLTSDMVFSDFETSEENN